MAMRSGGGRAEVDRGQVALAMITPSFAPFEPKWIRHKTARNIDEDISMQKPPTIIKDEPRTDPFGKVCSATLFAVSRCINSSADTLRNVQHDSLVRIFVSTTVRSANQKSSFCLKSHGSKVSWTESLSLSVPLYGCR
eukprot:scaffold9100_cov24-Prasinocladus_malaysianus.AAC.1